MIIRQIRTNMFRLTRVVVNTDGNILAELSEINRAGWVLTGGRSSRMGTDKALLEMGGRPLVLRVADQIGKVCGAVTLVGDPVKYGSLGLPVIGDRYRDQGPLAGIEAALGATEADWNLIVACDMPGLEAGWIETLFVVAEEGDGLDAVVPVHAGTGGLSAAPSRSRFGTDGDGAGKERDGVGKEGEEDKEGAIEPLCAVYHRRCGVEAAVRLQAGLRKVIDFVGGLEKVRYVRVSRSEQFANLNTPDDAARYPNG